MRTLHCSALATISFGLGTSGDEGVAVTFARLLQRPPVQKHRQDQQ